MTNPVVVELTRGECVESMHRGAFAVADAGGRLRMSSGDVDRAVYPRSAFKSMQALALVETGAADAFAVSPEELALACASHSGEKMHVDRVAAWLRRIDCSDADLACGPHLPFNEQAAHAMLRAGERPCRIHNNCSGKHTGFLTLARHLGASTAGYEHPDHKVQVQVRDAIGEACGVEPSSMPVGIDGCAAPNFALPLKHLAQGMARLGTGEGLGPDRARAASRLVAAWKAHPLLVSGTGRACADLISAAKGCTVVKTGAEGVFAAVLPEQGLGIALKIDDGATRASEALMAWLLEQLGVADATDDRVSKHLQAKIRNWRGDIVGQRQVVTPVDVPGLKPAN